MSNSTGGGRRCWLVAAAGLSVTPRKQPLVGSGGHRYYTAAVLFRVARTSVCELPWYSR